MPPDMLPIVPLYASGATLPERGHESFKILLACALLLLVVDAVGIRTEQEDDGRGGREKHIVGDSLENLY